MVNGAIKNARIMKFADRHCPGHSDLQGKSAPFDEICQTLIKAMILQESRASIMEEIDLDKIMQLLSEKEEHSFTYEMDFGGQQHTCQLKFMRMGDEHFIMGFRMIDDLVAAERDRQAMLESAKAAAEQAYIAAEHANQAKTTFLNSMSHDIRTPMNAILGFTALASNHLLSLINDVLDMSRIESGKIKIEERECSLSVVIHDLRNMLQSDIHDKRLELFIDTVDVMDESIICDRLRLNQILLNILSNAIKFTNPGGSVSLRVIEKETSPEGYADFGFIIRDNGIGMSEEFASHIFEPSTREERCAVSSIPGTGLGMAITKNLVDMMNGRISVSSELGKGSTFTVSFRFLKGSHELKKRGLKDFEGFRALVADDSTDA